MSFIDFVVAILDFIDFGVMSMVSKMGSSKYRLKSSYLIQRTSISQSPLVFNNQQNKSVALFTIKSKMNTKCKPTCYM